MTLRQFPEVAEDFPVRKTKRFPTWREPLLLACAVPTVALIHFAGFWWAFGFALAAIWAVESYFNKQMRCPSCRHKVLRRLVDIAENQKRVYYDCAECEISWDPDEVITRNDA